MVPCSQCSSFGCLGLIIWSWLSAPGVSFRFLGSAPLLLSLGLGFLALVDWFGLSVRGFSLGVLTLGLSVLCVLSWVLCSFPFSFCFRFLGLGLVIVTSTCSGRLTVAPRSGLFDFGSLCWLSGLGLDCLIFLGLAFRVVLLDSWAALGLGSLWVCWPMFSGWNGFASGFSGLCPHSGLAFSVARSPGSSPPVGLGFVDSWDVG